MRLEDFEGSWQIDRQIANAVGPDARFMGVAVFAPDAAGLVLEERGEMRVEGQAPLQATRRYHWRQGAAGIEVCFDDGRFFHLIEPGGRVQARHDCAPDLYLVTYDFNAWPRWSSTWVVSGPRKDYRMDSLYRPCGTDD